MNEFSIAVIPGDGIGNEVVPAAITVVDAAGERFGFQCRWTYFTQAYPITCRCGDC